MLGTWRAISETDVRPALILGTSNDDFKEINSQSAFATFSKAYGDPDSLVASPYGGAVYIFELEEWRPVGGLHLRYRDVSSLLQYSGADTHLTLSYTRTIHTLSLVLFGLELPGLAYSLSL